MTRMMKNISDTLADAALLEMGVEPAAQTRPRSGHDSETLEEMFIEAAFAEEADYDDIREEILREHQSERGIVHPDDCQYCDNDFCFA